jgi:hypothetical protein
VKTLWLPENRAEAEFAKAQERARKDIERSFDVEVGAPFVFLKKRKNGNIGQKLFIPFG